MSSTCVSLIVLSFLSSALRSVRSAVPPPSGGNGNSSTPTLVPFPVPYQVPVPYPVESKGIDKLGDENVKRPIPYPIPAPVDRPVVFPVHVKTSASPTSIHHGHDSLDIFERPAPVIPKGLLPKPQITDRFGRAEYPYVAGPMPEWLRGDAASAGGNPMATAGNPTMALSSSGDPLLDALMNPLAVAGGGGSMGMPGMAMNSMPSGTGAPNVVGNEGGPMMAGVGQMMGGIGDPMMMGGIGDPMMMGGVGVGGAMMGLGNPAVGNGVDVSSPTSPNGFMSYHTPHTAALPRFRALRREGDSSLASVPLPNGMSIHVPKDFVKKSHDESGALEDKDAAPATAFASGMRFRSRRTPPAEEKAVSSATRASARAPESIPVPSDAFRFKASTQATEKLKVIAQQQQKLQNQIRAAAAGGQANVMGSATALGNGIGGIGAPMGFGPMMSPQINAGMSLQPGAQLLMTQNLFLQQQMHVEMLQKRLAALNLVRKRIVAGMEMQRLMQQYRQVQMIDRALEMREAAETGVEEEIVRRASAVDGFMRDATKQIEELMNPGGNATNATATGNTTYVAPEAKTLELLSKAKNFATQARMAEDQAREAFFKQLATPPGQESKAKSGAEAGAEAAKAA